MRRHATFLEHVVTRVCRTCGDDVGIVCWCGAGRTDSMLGEYGKEGEGTSSQMGRIGVENGGA